MIQEKLEMLVIEEFLSYGDIVSEQLLKQLTLLKVIRRDFTGVGFFTYFSCPDSLAVDAVQKRYEGLSVNLKNSNDIMGFILYVEEGKIDCLEGYTTRSKWTSENIEELDVENIFGGGKSPFGYD